MGCCAKKKQENLDDLIDKKESNTNENNAIIQDPDLNKNSTITSNSSTVSRSKSLCYEDFTPIENLGSGKFGRVVLVRKNSNDKLYAMKVLLKSYLKRRHQKEHTKTERDLMVSVKCPFVMDLKYAFQDETQLYLISEFMQGGDMSFQFHERGRFSKETAKFYIIEIILALETLHKNNIIYRDLKPENILMDKEGHIKITDFGLSKILDDMNDKAFTLCGSPQYVAPEVLNKQGYDKGVDWWSLGCVLYEMLTGWLPFFIPPGIRLNSEVYKTPLRFPKDVDNIEIDLIQKLLCVDPKNRLGNQVNDAQEIKAHPFFKDVNWDDYLNKKVPVPFKPEFENELDLKYFNRGFNEEYVTIKPTTSRSRAGSEYKGFSYNENSLTNNKDKLGKINDYNQIKEEEEENEPLYIDGQ